MFSSPSGNYVFSSFCPTITLLRFTKRVLVKGGKLHVNPWNSIVFLILIYNYYYLVHSLNYEYHNNFACYCIEINSHGRWMFCVVVGLGVGLPVHNTLNYQIFQTFVFNANNVILNNNISCSLPAG